MSTPAWAQPRGEAERGLKSQEACSVASIGACESTQAGGAAGAAGAAGAGGSTGGGGNTDGKASAEAQFKGLMKQKNGGKAAWWQYLEPVLVKKEGKDWECKLKCIRGGPGACGALLTAKNPSKSCNEHSSVKAYKGFRVSVCVGTSIPT